MGDNLVPNGLSTAARFLLQTEMSGSQCDLSFLDRHLQYSRNQGLCGCTLSGGFRCSILDGEIPWSRLPQCRPVYPIPIISVRSLSRNAGLTLRPWIPRSFK